jgi:hypothetical protein
MSDEREHWSDHMGAREGRDIVRYYGRDEYGRPESFDTLDDYDPTENDVNTYLRELKARFRRKSNPEALRIWFEAYLASSEYTLDGALATITRGRLSTIDRPRYDALAVGVARLRQGGVTLEAIGRAVAKGARTVANLEARGCELLKADAEDEAERNEPNACRKHEKFQAECPACLRNAPDRVVRYGGHPDLYGQTVGGSHGI